MARSRDWFSRNWIWALPVGCLMPLLAGIASVFLIIYMSVSSLKSSDAYTLAMTELNNNKQVVNLVGTSMDSGWDVHGNVHVKKVGGNADLTIPLTGSKGKGTAEVRAVRVDGKWELVFLSFKSGEENPPLILLDTEPKNLAEEKPPENPVKEEPKEADNNATKIQGKVQSTLV